MKKDKRIYFNADKNFRKEVKVLCVENNKTFSALMRDVVLEYIATRKKKTPITNNSLTLDVWGL